MNTKTSFGDNGRDRTGSGNSNNKDKTLLGFGELKLQKKIDKNAWIGRQSMQSSSNNSMVRSNEEEKVRYDSIEFDMGQPSSGEQ